MKTVSLPLKTALQVSVVSSECRRTGKKYYTDLGLNMIEGNKDSYFAFPRQTEDKRILLKVLTEDQYNKAKRLIKPLHLSDSRGAPMHTVDNGYYFIELARGTAKHNTPKEGDREKYINVLADHLRVTKDLAERMIDDPAMDKEKFSIACDGMRPIWEHQAQEAIEFLQSIAHLSQK